MNVKHVSIFNLIEIFRGSRKDNPKIITERTHCEKNHLTDFYCDAENPFVSLKI